MLVAGGSEAISLPHPRFQELFTPLTGPEPEEAETQPAAWIVFVTSLDYALLKLTRPETDAVDPEEAREKQNSKDGKKFLHRGRAHSAFDSRS